MLAGFSFGAYKTHAVVSGLVSNQCFIALVRQPIAFGPSFIGAGNVPSFTAWRIALLHKGTVASTVGKRITGSMPSGRVVVRCCMFNSTQNDVELLFCRLIYLTICKRQII